MVRSSLFRSACLATFLMLGMSQASAGDPPVGGVSPIKKCLPQSLGSETTFDWQQYKGKVLYIDFWASWCGPCRASFPFMNDLQKEFAGELVVLGLSVDASKADAESFLEKTPAEFSLAIDSEGVCPKEFAVKGMPSTYILGPNGELLYSHKGFRKSDKEKLREKVVEILQSVEVTES